MSSNSSCSRPPPPPRLTVRPGAQRPRSRLPVPLCLVAVTPCPCKMSGRWSSARADDMRRTAAVSVCRVVSGTEAPSACDAPRAPV
eukprot:5090945-Prymnesium_polylepis.2